MADSKKGFTLLEMVISITLLAMLMTALVTGLRIGVRAWQKGEQRLRTIALEQERREFLAHQVASLVPYAVNSSDPQRPGRYYVLEAAPTRLRFLSSYASQGRAEAGLTMVELGRVERGDRRVNLVLRETPMRGDNALLEQLIRRVARDPESGQMRIQFQPFTTQETDVILFEDLQTAEFAYFGRLRSVQTDRGPGWTASWEGTPEAPFPQAIRLRWQRDGGEAGEQIFPVRAQVFQEVRLFP